jgi:hypothetical protein
VKRERMIIFNAALRKFLTIFRPWRLRVCGEERQDKRRVSLSFFPRFFLSTFYPHKQCFLVTMDDDL